MHARPVREQWDLGAYDIERRDGWIQLGTDRSAETLLPIIQQWCLPGTIIVSDGWRAYGGLGELGFHHEIVVHEHFLLILPPAYIQITSKITGRDAKKG